MAATRNLYLKNILLEDTHVLFQLTEMFDESRVVFGTGKAENAQICNALVKNKEDFPIASLIYKKCECNLVGAVVAHKICHDEYDLYIFVDSIEYYLEVLAHLKDALAGKKVYITPYVKGADKILKFFSTTSFVEESKNHDFAIQF